MVWARFAQAGLFHLSENLTSIRERLIKIKHGVSDGILYLTRYTLFLDIKEASSFELF